MPHVPSSLPSSGVNALSRSGEKPTAVYPKARPRNSPKENQSLSLGGPIKNQSLKVTFALQDFSTQKGQ